VSVEKMSLAEAMHSMEKPIPSQVPFLTVNEEEFPMTMQVGMVGTDGVLIASDTRWMNTPRWANSGSPPRATFDSPKIIVNHERGIAVSCARNMETARRVAIGIISGLKDEDWEYPILPIERIGEEILPSAGDRNEAQCLIAFVRPAPRLFLFQFAEVNGKWGPWCQQMQTRVIAGDNVNPAIFWAERYYRELPIENLLPLASHLIVTASKLNPTAISGLEIVLCNASGLRRLSDDSVRGLKLKAAEWDENIGNLFLNYRQQFTYAPDVAR
jgi:hypothetical protein